METDDRRGRRRHCGFLLAGGLGLFFVFLAAAGFTQGRVEWLFVALSVASLVLCTARALSLWDVDGLVFEPGRSEPPSEPPADSRRPTAETASRILAAVRFGADAAD